MKLRERLAAIAILFPDVYARAALEKPVTEPPKTFDKTGWRPWPMYTAYGEDSVEYPCEIMRDGWDCPATRLKIGENPAMNVAGLYWRPLRFEVIPAEPKHVHEWKAPKPDISTDAGIMLSIIGQICDCGAKRIYEGPMYGWKMIA
jgi:hypothetical protein